MKTPLETVGLKEIVSKAVMCKNCVKLHINKENLECDCIAFERLYYLWDKPPKECWAYQSSEQEWSDTLDIMHRYSKERLQCQNVPKNGALSIHTMKENMKDRKLTSDEMVGVGKAYYDSIHVQLTKPPSNDSCGSRCKIIKKNQLLDNDGGGESWKPIGNMASCMKEYDDINERKKRRSMEAKKKGKQNPTTELKGSRKPNTGRIKETKLTDSSVVITNKSSGRLKTTIRTKN